MHPAGQIVALGVVSFLGSVVTAGFLHFVGLWTAPVFTTYPDPFAHGLAGAIWRVVLLGPLVETLLLGLLYLMCRTAFAARPAAAMAGLAVAALHIFKGWPAVVCVVIPFQILAMPFASPRWSWRTAAVRSFAIHAVHNACVVLFVAVAIGVPGR